MTRGVKKEPFKLSSPQTVFKSAASQKCWISKLKALSSQSLFSPLVCRSHLQSVRWLGGGGGAEAHLCVSPPPIWGAVALWEQDSSWDARLSLLRWCVNRAGADRWAPANRSRWPFNPTVHHSPRHYKKMQWNSKEIIILYATQLGQRLQAPNIQHAPGSAFPGALANQQWEVVK